MKMINRLALFAGAMLAASTAAQAQVVISQVYGGGGNASATLKQDFIEIHNNGASPVAIGGWSVQYTSATGTFGGASPLITVITPGTILPAGSYYVIRESQGSGGTTDTPSDQIALSPIAMSATAGKVALVNDAVALTGSCPTGPTIVDFVGYGLTATCFEGTGPTPAPSNITSVSRNVSNTDTNQNATDFTSGSPNPRVCGCATSPAANLAVGAVTDAPDPLVGFPGNVVYSFAGVTNAGPNNAAGVTVTTTLPTGASFVSTTASGGGSVSGALLTINLGTINNGGASPAFTVTLSATQAFPVEQLLVLDWAATYGGESDASDNVARTRTEVITPGDINTGPVLQNDIAWGWNMASALNTLKLVRNSTSATPVLVRNSWRQQPFAESAEFDNLGGVQRNPAGNLLALNFGAAATGGLVYSYSTGNLNSTTGIVIGQWTDASTFTSGSATSVLSRSRISGICISPGNTKVAFFGDDSASVYVFDYDADGPNYLSNGRELPFAFGTGSSCGGAWLDDNTLAVAAGGTAQLTLKIISDDGFSLTQGNSNTVFPTGGGNMFTDVEYLPQVSNLLIMSVGRFASGTFNHLYVYDTTSATWQTDAPAGSFNYSTSVNTMREIGYDSQGNLILGQFGGSTPSTEPLTPNTPAIDRIPAATTLGAFADNNSTTIYSLTNLSEPNINLSVSFNGLGVAAGVVGGGGGCNLADITEIGGTTENPGNPDGQLTVDDIIVFINAFSDSIGCPGANPPNGPACNVSDVTGIGGPPELPDGQLTVDDIIAFFNAFSDGCL